MTRRKSPPFCYGASIVLAAASWMAPAIAQGASDPGAAASAGGGSSGAASTGAGTSLVTPPSPVFGGTSTPPLFPSTGFGYAGGPATYTGGPSPFGAPTAPPLATTALGPLAPGAVPLQAGDPRAPAIIYIPSASAFVGFTDNPRGTPSTYADAYARLSPGLTISADTPRLQGQLSYSLDILRYARATDQNAINQNFLGYGLFSIIPEKFVIDARAGISQVSQTGNTGFANSANIPPSQQSQALTASLSPTYRQSFGDWVDTQLTYSFGLTDYGNGSLTGEPSNAALLGSPQSALSNTIQNELSFVAGTGSEFSNFGSKLTLDASKVSSSSIAASNQLRAINDFEYRITPFVSALATAGYESLRYPDAPSANYVGPTWQAGVRLLPSPDSSAILKYGKVDGFYGFNGQLQQKITPSTELRASLTNNLSSPEQQMLSNLDNSSQDAYGTLINRGSGLPGGLANPEFSYATTDIYRYREVRIGVTTSVGRDSFSLFAFLDHEASQTGATGDDTARGINFSWFRSITPKLSSAVSLGYAAHVLGHGKTYTNDIALNYAMTDTLSGVVHYQFIDSESDTVGEVFRQNLFEVGLRKVF